MRAARFHEFGGPEVVVVEEVPDPAPASDQVLMKVKACALNHLDVDIREGVSRFPIEPPHILGLEVVGEIVELGSEVDGDWKVGDRVLPYLMDTRAEDRYTRSGRENLCLAPGFFSFTTSGGYAELANAPASTLVRVPDALEDGPAAATQIAFATAWHMLFARGRLRPGETVMVNSVGSGVGSAAIQLASWAGARVIGNASTDQNLERAARYGMEAGINHATEDVPARVRELTGGQGVDMVVEFVGGASFQRGLESLAKDGRLVTCGAHSGEVVPFDIIPFFRQEHSIIGSFVYTKSEVEQVVELAARGAITPLVHTAMPLDEAREAMELMESRRHFGKIVLVP